MNNSLGEFHFEDIVPIWVAGALIVFVIVVIALVIQMISPSLLRRVWLTVIFATGVGLLIAAISVVLSKQSDFIRPLIFGGFGIVLIMYFRNGIREHREPRATAPWINPRKQPKPVANLKPRVNPIIARHNFILTHHRIPRGDEHIREEEQRLKQM